VSPEFRVSERIPESAVAPSDPKLIMNAVEAALRDSRKFNVYTRRAVAEQAIADEQTRKQSVQYTGDGAETGEMRTAEYVAVITLRDFSFRRDEDKVPDMDTYRRIDSVDLNLQIQFVNTSTGENAGSYTESVERSTEPTMVSSTGGRPDQDLLSTAARSAATAIVRRFLNNVFPMRVVHATGEQLWINVGGKSSLDPGTELVVYGQGKKITDPATGEVIKRVEVKKGRAEVVRVKPKVTIAKILSTEKPVENGDVLRRVE